MLDIVAAAFKRLGDCELRISIGCVTYLVDRHKRIEARRQHDISQQVAAIALFLTS